MVPCKPWKTDAGFALVEHSAGIEELFGVGHELDTYRDLAELEEKVRWYLAHPESAKAIGARGRTAVLERHAFSQRVRSMLAHAGFSEYRASA